MLFNTGNKKITCKQAKDIMEKEKVKIIDVRTKKEYDKGHIKNSILISDFSEIEKINLLLKDKEEKILVYCESGVRSSIATKKLYKMGYKNVFDFGGISSWPYEIVK